MSNFETDFATAFEVKCVISKALGEFEKDPWTTMDVLASNIVEALNEQVFRNEEEIHKRFSDKVSGTDLKRFFGIFSMTIGLKLLEES